MSWQSFRIHVTGCMQCIHVCYLVPHHINDPIEAVTHFNTEFIRRYGDTTHPAFYPGSLKDAVDNALQVNAFEVSA